MRNQLHHLADLNSSAELWTFQHAAHRGRPAAVALVSTLHADLGVAVGRVEPARLLPLLPLLQELEGQSCGDAVSILLKHERRDSGRDLHVALVPRLVPDDGVPVGVTRPVALHEEKTSAARLTKRVALFGFAKARKQQ